jgi:acyl-coenzyme A synthetase/AMP-(fatty) acid ligase
MRSGGADRGRTAAGQYRRADRRGRGRGGDALLWDFFEIGETITYSEMRRTVNGLATRLVALGITKGTHIASCCPISPPCR